jgi:FHA domain
MSDTKTGHSISGAAGLIVLLFFFLPWASVSCAGQSLVQVSGSDLATGNLLIDGDMKLYLVPLVGIIVIGLVIAAVRYAITEEASTGGQIIAALIGFFVLWLKWDEISGAAEGFDLITALTSEVTGTSGGEIFSFNMEYGLYGSVIGLVLVLVGAVITLIAARASPEFTMEESFSAPTISESSTPLSPPLGDSVQQTESYFGDSDVSPSGMAGATSAMGSSFPGGGDYERPSPETEVLRKEPESLAWLVITDGPRTGHQFRLFENNGIGRDAENEIVLDDTSLSGRHARIRIEEGTFYIYDLASTNGTFMFDKSESDWKQIYREPLGDGDRVKFGRTILHFMMVDTSKNAS